MLPFLAPLLEGFWGPFRLFGSHLVLIGLGVTVSSLAVWWVLPRVWMRLPRDQGKPFVKEGEEAKGKPTGAGIVLIAVLTPVLALVLPPSPQFWELTGCLILAMLTGYLDDCREKPWGPALKGTLDLGVALLASWALCQGKDMTVWWPLFKGARADGSFVLPVALYLPMATVVLWWTINATNCTDGVDGLAGSLTLLSLFYLGGFLYGIVGHVTVAKYMILPHNPEGARWAVLILTAAGALAGYLWHNAKPSAVLMGDAGSRFLGLLLGIAVLAVGNPAAVLVVAPVVLVNGGSGLVKILLLKGFGRLGFDVRPPARNLLNAHPSRAASEEEEARQHAFIRLLHRYRFPLHDHCRKNLGWSDPQVLVRFVLLQALLIPLLLGLLVKVR
ncbi:MAG: phospho-N-acetylmuramoyl-pentapeptide-transferase [Lentisphaeria bacterium]|nr:phospho-N-acetylmuramoyl-pentapeptide-transferase [Lentisphaeria bacterium]